MWNLDDKAKWNRVLQLEIPSAKTWADTRPGHTDREKRERIREKAVEKLSEPAPAFQEWAIRIRVWKGGSRRFDIENVPKPIVDAFCQRQIREDGSSFERAGLYPDDSVDYLTILQVAGERTDGPERTLVEIFGRDESAS